MSKKLTARDFMKIKALTAKGKSKYDIAQELGFSVKTIQHARNVSSYDGYRKRYVESKYKTNEVHLPKAIPAPVKAKSGKISDPEICVLELKSKPRNEWKRVAVTSMAILGTLLVGAIAVEALLIAYLWSNYVR